MPFSLHVDCPICSFGLSFGLLVGRQITWHHIFAIYVNKSRVTKQWKQRNNKQALAQWKQRKSTSKSNSIHKENTSWMNASLSYHNSFIQTTCSLMWINCDRLSMLRLKTAQVAINLRPVSCKWEYWAVLWSNRARAIPWLADCVQNAFNCVQQVPLYSLYIENCFKDDEQWAPLERIR